MSNTDKWILGIVLSLILLVTSAIMVDHWYTYSMKSKCIEKHGEWIGDTCIFRQQPPIDEVIVPKVHS